jgi:two-component system, chemotaxis family, sensor kinase CheA
MRSMLRYLILPAEVSAFEARYLARMNRVALWFFVAHVPLFAAIAALNETGPLQAVALTCLALAGPVWAVYRCPARLVSMAMGVAAMFMGGILAHIGQGPVQIEMHFYFFVLIALLAVFANPAVILAAAATATAHHAVIWLLLPASVFNYDAPLWVVGVHAAFVVLESVAACYIARSFFDNVVGLERIVAERTAEVDARNRDMRMLLDAVDQGFFTVNPQGVVSDERSAAVERWLGPGAAGATLADLVRPHDPMVADWLALGFDDVFADLMPVEVTIDQLPRRLRLGDRTLKLEYAPIPRQGPPQALAVVMTDVTATVARERLEAEHRVLLVMVDRISRDKPGFLEFVKEADEIIGTLAAGAPDDLACIKRLVHTLKGNAAVFGLDSVASACHVIEDHIADTGTPPEPGAWALLNSQWETVRDNLKRLVGDAPTGIALDDGEYATLLLAVLNGAPRDVVARQVAEWRLEPTGVRMSRICDQARLLAARLQKGDIEVRVRGGQLRTDPERWAFFWSAFIHVVRNAVDHGLELPAERRAAGKPPAGVIELATRIDGDRFVITLADDGRGIDWARVAKAAAAKGLPAACHDDLVEALFHDGLSTAAVVSSTSGRGVGMGAVRDACHSLGGRILVRSEAGKGTTFEFRFPIAVMAPDTHELLRLHGVRYPDLPPAGTESSTPDRPPPTADLVPHSAV